VARTADVAECRDLMVQIAGKTEWIEATNGILKELAAATDPAPRPWWGRGAAQA